MNSYNEITLESINTRLIDLEQKIDEIKSILNDIKSSHTNIERGTNLMESHTRIEFTVDDIVASTASRVTCAIAAAFP